MKAGRTTTMSQIRQQRGTSAPIESGFTLLEVMIAVGVLGIAMLALLSLHDSNLQSVSRGNEMSTAATLAQGMMSDAELERFPMPGKTSGNFQKLFPGVYPKFSWARMVEASPMFPDIRKVQITVFYGPKFRHSFSVVEFVHDPEPQQDLIQANANGNGSGQNGQQQQQQAAQQQQGQQGGGGSYGGGGGITNEVPPDE
jgi:prepilin-type N-terminal cleavage/methylation domain-containing protein